LTRRSTICILGSRVVKRELVGTVAPDSETRLTPDRCTHKPLRKIGAALQREARHNCDSPIKRAQFGTGLWNLLEVCTVSIKSNSRSNSAPASTPIPFAEFWNKSKCAQCGSVIRRGAPRCLVLFAELGVGPGSSVLVAIYYTGMRIGEVLAIKWDEADIPEREIHLEPGTTKHDEARTLPLHGELLEVIQIQRAMHDRKHPACQPVFFARREADQKSIQGVADGVREGRTRKDRLRRALGRNWRIGCVCAVFRQGCKICEVNSSRPS